MPLQLTPADDTHCTFARDLTRRAMLPYYREYDLLWIEEAFDEAWGWREQWLVTEGSTLLGFCSLSQDRQALFIRELHLLPEHLPEATPARLPSLKQLPDFKQLLAQRLRKDS